MYLSFRKRKNNKFAFILVFFVFLVFFIFFNSSTKAFFYNLLLPLSPVFKFVHSAYQDNIYPIFNAASVYKENKALKEEIAFFQKKYFDDSIQKKRQNESVVLDGFETVKASLFSRGIGKDFILLYASGQNNSKIGVGFPVLSLSGNLIGFVEDVFMFSPSKNLFIKVGLLSKKDSVLQVVNFKGEDIGILRGLGDGKLMLDLIPRDADLKEGYYLFSKSDKENIPDGFLVGKVQKVYKNDLESYFTADVTLVNNPFAYDYFNVIVMPK